MTDLELLDVEVVEPLPLDDAIVSLELPHLQLQLQPQEVDCAQGGQFEQPVDRGELLNGQPKLVKFSVTALRKESVIQR